MSGSIALAHLTRRQDGVHTVLWGPYVLHSAFQPILAFHEGRLRIAGFEGLLRPFRDGEAVEPVRFFNAVAPGERLHAETVSRTLHLINGGAFLDPAIRLFVNFTPSVFHERAIADAALTEMRAVLAEAGVDPRRVVCEVTEERARSMLALERFVGALRDNGFAIAVDDYGAQESDMTRIAKLRPDIVKFDGGWVARLMGTRPGAALLATMVHQFEDRSIRTVFEGLEETWQVELAETIGVSMVQGFALARPELAPWDFSAFAVHSAQGPVGTVADRPVPARRKPFGRRPA